MLIFTTFKEKDWRQINALLSWDNLGAEAVYYDDDCDLVRNEFGTPILPDLFRKAEQDHLTHEIFAYVNSDIILFPGFVEAAQLLYKLYPQFLMVGRRWNWQEPRTISFDDLTRNRPQFLEEVRTHGRRFNAATDVFCFRRGSLDFDAWPPFALGRYYWDGWILWHTTQTGIPVVDVTDAAFMIHQNHRPYHRSWDEEGKRNLEMALESEKAGFDLDDVPFEMREDLTIVKRG